MKSPLPSIHIILVEDDQDLRQSLCEYLDLSGFGVSSAGTAREFYACLDDARHHIAIIDLGLPDQSGHVLLDYLRQNTSLGIIVITATNSVDNRIQSFQRGSDLFLAKPIDTHELTQAITALAGRIRQRDPAVAASSSSQIPGVHPWILDRSRWLLISPLGVSCSLTARERDLLMLLAGRSGQTVSRMELLDVLYRRNDETAQRALDTQIRRLRNRIATLHADEQPIKTIYGSGYCFSPVIELR